MTTSQRLEGIDAVRAAAIVSVVVIHAARPLEPDFYRDHVVGGVARLGVPLFVLLSGFLAGLRETPRERFAVYFRRFLWLHLLWALVYWPITVARLGWPDPVTWKYVALRFGNAAWPGQYYFLIMVQVFFLAAYVVPVRWWRRGAVVACCGLLAVPAMINAHYLPGSELSRQLPRPLGTLLFLQTVVWFWLYYFSLGAWIGDRLRRGTAPRPPRPWILAMLAAALLVAAFGLPLPFEGSDPTQYAYRRPRIYIAATAVALCLPALASWRFPRPVLSLGRVSFGVFVLNPAILFALFALVGRPTGPLPSLALAAVCLALAVPLARLLRRWVPWAYA